MGKQKGEVAGRMVFWRGGWKGLRGGREKSEGGQYSGNTKGGRGRQRESQNVGTTVGW